MTTGNARPLGSDCMTNPVRIESLAAIQQLAQGLLHQLLAANRRQIKDSHVLWISPLAVEAAQRIVGAPEDETREQLLAPAVAGKGAGLLHQRPDHVMIIDPRPALAAQPRQPLHQLARVVHLELIVMEMDSDSFAD